ncbi:hypothetical protein GTW51_15950 [Aurantimonas aggregata]|uniref:Uncharacterized protein n=1 Tax=Aurantimonas aggregata TaxID=2047720 RepID=A0A6L9MJW7_9HYPH|nr:hypothetical protein [Aurantimonas aggregata]NDV88194.1 hypothetical protein [Aurantimonas aggregata]
MFYRLAFRTGSMPPHVSLLGAALLAGVAAATPTIAQESDPVGMVDADPIALGTIESRLNEAGICTPLTFDLRVVSGLVGMPIPSFIPIDTNLRWDQSRHKVARFASTPERVRLDFEMACQPSSNGAVLEFLGLKPEALRLSDTVVCTGERAGDGSLASLVCAPEGRIGRFLSKTIIGLSDKVGRLLPMHLAVPVSEVVAPFGPVRPPQVPEVEGPPLTVVPSVDTPSTDPAGANPAAASVDSDGGPSAPTD